MLIYAKTHKGLVRPTNQDSLLVAHNLYGVADGMGGHRGGETASRIAVQVVRTVLTYPPSVGRSVDEILRTLDALQLTDKNPVATPVEWKPGDEVVVSPKLSDADAEKQFGSFRKVKPYLRFTQAPKG